MIDMPDDHDAHTLLALGRSSGCSWLRELRNDACQTCLRRVIETVYRSAPTTAERCTNGGLERDSPFFYRVVVRVVVVSVLRDFRSWVIQHCAYDSRPDVHELLVRSFGCSTIGLPRPHHEKHPVSKRGKDAGVSRGKHGWRVQDDQVEVLRELLQQHPHPHSAEEIGRVRGQ